jgi:hypothetical protein
MYVVDAQQASDLGTISARVLPTVSSYAHTSFVVKERQMNAHKGESQMTSSMNFVGKTI